MGKAYEVTYTFTKVGTVVVNANSFEEAEKEWSAIVGGTPDAELFRIVAPDGEEHVYRCV